MQPVTVDALRDAFDRRDFTQLLSLSLRPTRCRNDRERLTVLYYRAYACCCFKAQAPVLKGTGRNLIEQVVAEMKPLRHPLLVPALINAAAQATSAGDIQTGRRHAQFALGLALKQGHPRLYDAVLSAQSTALGSRDRELAAQTIDLQARYLVHGAETHAEATFGRYEAAHTQCKAYMMLGERKTAQYWAQVVDQLRPQSIQPAQEVYGHDCDVVSYRITGEVQFIYRLLRNGLAADFVDRLRSLQRSVAAATHLCTGAQANLWLNLAYISSHLFAPAAPRFGRLANLSALNLRRTSQETIDYLVTLHHRLSQFRPRRLRGEVADLLSPDAWPFQPRSEAEMIPAAAQGLDLLN